MKTEREKAVERVAKLLALAGGTSNEHEAAAAAAKAQEILLAHNLKMSEVAGYGKDEDDSIKVDTTYVERDSSTWRKQLANVVAEATMCRLLTQSHWSSAKARTFVFVGREANIQTAKYMYEYLAREILAVSPKPHGTRVSNSFRRGAVVSVGKKLRETLVEFKNASADTLALVVNEDAALQAVINARWPKLRVDRAIGDVDSQAFWAGMAAGEKIQIRRGVSNDRNVGGQALLG